MTRINSYFRCLESANIAQPTATFIHPRKRWECNPGWRSGLIFLGFVFAMLLTDLVGARTITVTTFDDTFSLVGPCSLRSAVAAANGATLVNETCGFGDPGEDIISLPPGNYYLLTPDNGIDEAWGDLDIFSELTLAALSGNVSIRQEADVNGQIHGRVIEVKGNGILTIRNVSISGGDTVVAGAAGEQLSGGGILNRGRLVLDQVVVSGNSASAGGGIASVAGSVLVLDDSTVSANIATGTGGGGGVLATDAQTFIHRSTISGNESYADGGGILSAFGGSVFITNSTVSGNDAWVSGGGLHNDGAGISLSNVTITANTANSDDSPDNDGLGGGLVHVDSPGVPFNLWNTLVAGNVHLFTGFGFPNPDCVGDINSMGYNLIGFLGLACAIIDTGGAIGDQVGDNGTIDPLLGGLADNAGSTETHALLPGSPAIDGGNPQGCREAGGGVLSNDQRGYPRPVGFSCDIGAFELGELFSLSVVAQGGGSVLSDPLGIDCPDDCDQDYANATAVTLTTIAEPGFVFDSWTGDCGGSGACVLDMVLERNVEAIFVLSQDVIFADRFR